MMLVKSASTIERTFGGLGVIGRVGWYGALSLTPDP